MKKNLILVNFGVYKQSSVKTRGDVDKRMPNS